MSAIERLRFYLTPKEHNCSYLAEHRAKTLFVDPSANIDLHQYSLLSQVGFRRSGQHFYRPHCNGCNACIPTRIPARSFTYSKSQKRVLNKNRDLQIGLAPAQFSPEHYQLYAKYICQRHADGDMFPPSTQQYRAFLVNGALNTQFLEFRLAGRLLAVAVIDLLEDGCSAIYSFFDPEEDKRSLGMLAILAQVQLCKALRQNYVYLGYWIKNCTKMQYKLNYRPVEIYVNHAWLQVS